MKLIRCPHCGAEKIGPKSERWPDGGPVVMARWVGTAEFPLTLKCHRCTNVVRLRAPDFNRLPEMSETEVERFAPSAQLAVD